MFDTNASLGLGKNMTVVEKATYFAGINAYGKALIGGVSGNYEIAALGNLTPNSKCKENGCDGAVGAAGGRLNNLPVCPIPSSQGNLLYITLSGGGLLIGKTDTTPMTLVAEYGNNIVYGGGCGGAEVGKVVYLNSGVSSAASGLNQSDFSLWAFDSSKYMDVPFQPENEPLPLTVFSDDGNTATLGNLQGPLENLSGQLPSQSTRRDSHGIVAIANGNYVHTFDRIQAEVYVVDTATNTGSFAYSLRNSGVCKGITDDTNLPEDDPSPDLLDTTPDGLYIAIAFRGPAPVTFAHTTQGSCPGVGIVKLDNGGRNGKLITVLRTTNLTPDSIPVVVVPGGVNYVGKERSDIHMVAVIDRNKWAKANKAAAKAEKTKSPQAKAGKKTVFNL